MNNLEKDVDTLTELLNENREDVSTELSKFADEESFMRMQLMLREYFKKGKKQLQQKIEREAQLILTIFPDVNVEHLKEWLFEIGDDPNRSKIVINRLSSKNGIKRVSNKAKDDFPLNKKLKREVIVIKEDDAVICVDDDDDVKDTASGSGATGSKDESEVSETDLEENALNVFDGLAGPSGYSPPNDCQTTSSSTTNLISKLRGPLIIPKQDDIANCSLKTLSASSEAQDWTSSDDDDDEDYDFNFKSWQAKTNRKLVQTELFNKKFQLLRDILPDADPRYLEEQCKNLIANDPRQFDLFVSVAVENRNYPTIEDNSRVQNLRPKNDPTEMYTTKFNVSEFLEVIPDPETYFDKKRVTKPWPEGCAAYAVYVLSKMYNRVAPNVVVNVLQNASNFLAACEVLDTYQWDIVQPKHFPTPIPIQNISLLQEIAFKTHYNEIMQFLMKQKESLKQRVTEAITAGTIQTCICCYDEEVLPDDMFECEQHCRFCKECIRRSVEISYGNGKLMFECLNNCPAQFTLNILEKVLPPKLFTKISYKKQMEEVKAAGIENLEFCPFCDFAAIPAQENRIFSCLNPECMKESCRLCKEPSHIPYRCEEVEKDENVQARTYIENKMTEALLKKCYQCSKPFIKDDGCNMITCSCGAKMCYLCEKIVTSYDHFNGLGGEHFERCPLYTDTLKMSEQKVKEVAQKAKKEVIQGGKLKIDPTADIPNYFEQLRKKRGPVPHLQVLEWMQAQNEHGRVQDQVLNALQEPARIYRRYVNANLRNRDAALQTNANHAYYNNRLPNRQPIQMPNYPFVRFVNAQRAAVVKRARTTAQPPQVIAQPGSSASAPIRFGIRLTHQNPAVVAVNPQPPLPPPPPPPHQSQKRARLMHRLGIPTPISDYYETRTVPTPMDLSMSETPQAASYNVNEYHPLPLPPGYSNSQPGPSNNPYINRMSINAQPGHSNYSYRPRRSINTQPEHTNFYLPEGQVNASSRPSTCTYSEEDSPRSPTPQMAYTESPIDTYQNRQPGPSNGTTWVRPPTRPNVQLSPLEQLIEQNSGVNIRRLIQSDRPGPSTCTHPESLDKFQPWN